MALLPNDTSFIFDGNSVVSWTFENVIFKNKKNILPERATYNGKTTIVFWSDGTKTLVRCGVDNYDREVAVAMAVAHKMFGTKNKFKKFVANGYEAMTIEEEELREAKKAAKKAEQERLDRENNLF